MTNNWVDIPRKHNARGIDSYSARSNIPDGYSERLENFDTNASGKLSTRKGHQGYGGWVPLRVTKASHTGTSILFQFDSSQSVSLADVGVGPIIVYGKVPSDTAPVGGYLGDITTTNGATYYPTYTIDNRETLLSGSNTLTKTASQHGLSTPYIFTGLVEIDFAGNTAEWTLDETAIHTGTYDITLGYTASAAATGVFYYKDKSAVVGTTYISTVAATTKTFVDGNVNTGTEALTVTTHGFTLADRVGVSNSGGALPTGLSASTDYYVNVVDANTIKLAASAADAVAGPYINITAAAGGGTHTLTKQNITVTIPAATHGLSNFNIIARCYDSSITASHITEVKPDEVTISTAGSVAVTFVNSFVGSIILTAVPLANSVSVVPVTGANTISFPVSTPYNFYAIYEYDGTNYLQVEPDDIEYNATTGQTSISYLVAGSALAVEIYYESADVIANVISVTDIGTVSESWSTTEPQLTVWGIPHEGIYLDNSSRGGHVNHIDTYKTTAEERLICGLGGSLFAARTRDEIGTAYLLPELYYTLKARANAAVNIAPLFDATGSTVIRTRGLITDTSIESNKALVTTINYISSGVVDVTLSFTNKSGNIANGGVIDVNKDKLTITGMAKDANNGSFLITAVTSDSATSTVLRIANSSASSSQVNEAGAKGRAGVFTDELSISTSPMPFIEGDIITCEAFTVTEDMTAVYTAAGIFFIDGVTEEMAIPDGVLFYGTRESSLLPLRTSAGIADVDDFVRGDMISISGFDRLMRVKNVRPVADVAITFVSTGGTITVTTGSAHNLNIGQKVCIRLSTVANYNGDYTIVSTPSTTTFTAACSTTGSGSGFLMGEYIEVDEDLTLTDTVLGLTVTVEERWIPIEAPTTAFDLPAETYVKHFDENGYADQPIIRSTMVNDTMFLVNKDDEVMKFDGTNIYRAGLIKWQPALFVQLNTTGSLVNDVTNAAYTNKSTTAKWFEVALGSGFKAGDRVEDSVDSAVYTVVDVTTDSAVEFVYVEKPISSATTTGTLSQVASYRYYARLNAIDANNNIIATAATDSQDLIVEFATAKQPRLRFVGLPAFDLLDYDRIELELYRTKANTPAPFYRAARQLITFDNNEGYFDVYDGTPDSVLKDLDSVHTALEGAELGTAWEGPLRAAHITSVDNRLILADVKGYPELDITLRLKAASTAVTTANLDGLTWTLRRDSTSSSTTADNVDVLKYKFVATGASQIRTISGISDNAGKARITISAGLSEGLSVGSWVYLYHAAAGTDNDLTYAGWYQVTATAASAAVIIDTNYPYTAASNIVDRLVFVASDTKAVPVLLGTDGNYNTKEGNTSESYEGLAMRRLAHAINASMRMVDTGITAQADFKPFICAYSGNDYALGQLKLSKPFIDDVTPELQLPTLAGSDTFEVFVNDLIRTSTESVAMQTRIFPSRIIKSYAKFPEIFDNPTAIQAEQSASSINVNESDGQANTAIIPFFGESSFGSASLSQAIVAFKERSIYLYNALTDELQKLDSRGLGCTAPFSVAATKNGIMFANESGVYRLNRDMTITHVGKLLEGLWRDETAINSIAEFTGHQYALGRKYKLSFVSSGTYNDKVYVYDHDTEGQGQEWGSWAVYTNHPATGWANKGQDAYFSSQSGDVFSMRRLNEASDYRDDADAVATQTVILRPEDFDAPGTRKVVSKIATLLDLDTTDVTGLELETAINLTDSFDSAGSVEVEKDDNRSITYRSSLEKRRGNYIQAKYTHSTKDEACIIAGVSYRVSSLTDKGIKQSAKLIR